MSDRRPAALPGAPLIGGDATTDESSSVRLLKLASGMRLAARCCGPSRGIPALLLHGVQGCAALWTSVARVLA
jgi:pimeloyl-ACP methyl ester carboxylesterase